MPFVNKKKIFKKWLIKFSRKPPNMAGEVSVKLDKNLDRNSSPKNEALESEVNKGFKGTKKIW